MKRTTLIAALAAVTSLSACMEDTGATSGAPVVVTPTPTAPTAPVSGQSGQSLEQTVGGKGPVVVDASAV